MLKKWPEVIQYGGCLVGKEEEDAILKVIRNQGRRRWTLGEESLALEFELAQKAGVDYSVIVNSGSSALLLAISALKLPKNSKVIIPALNFPTAYSSLLQNNLKPVVVDCDINTLNLDLEAVKQAIRVFPDIKAVVAVHIAGNIVDLPKLREIVGDRYIVSDNCIAEGTLIKTDSGDKPIENINIGDMVMTRKGYRKVTKTWDKGYQKVITKLGVTATPDHRFITNNGEKEFKNLQPSDILYQWNDKLLSIEEKSISDILRQNDAIVVQNVKRVFDLSVQGEHEFFANNILVHNCDGFGGTLNGKPIDSYADVSCASFHAAHIICMGEGGAVLTSNEKIADTARKMREWGRASGSDKLTHQEGFPEDYRERYVFEEIGYNMKPLELQCAMGRVQLRRLNGFVKKRRENYYKLKEIFDKDDRFKVIKADVKGENSCWFGFPFLCTGIERKRVMEFFESMNIEVRTIFSGNILRHPAYKNTGIQSGMLTNSDTVMRQGMFIGNHPSMTPEQFQYIKETLKELK